MASVQQAAKVTVGSYVTVSENFEDFADAASGPLTPLKCGMVMRQDGSHIPFMVRGVQALQQFCMRG